MKKLLMRLSVIILALCALIFTASCGSSAVNSAFQNLITPENSEAPKVVDHGAVSVKYVEPEDGSIPYLYKVYEDGTPCADDFKVYNFTDTHFEGGYRNEGDEDPADEISFSILEKVITADKPDLVTISGDICLGKGSEEGIKRLADIFEKTGTYWAIVMGNHDGENGTPRAELIKLYENCSLCLTKNGPTDIAGNGNYMINLKSADGKIARTLVFMDSGKSRFNREECEKYGLEYQSGYDCIKPDQIEWYKTTLKAQAEKLGYTPPSTLTIHIPLCEFRTAYNDSGKNLLFGMRIEDECCSPINTGMFAAIKEVGSTDTVIAGHDHVNDYGVEYEGVTLLYSKSSSFNSYFARKNVLCIMGAAFGNYEFSDGHEEFTYGQDGSKKIVPVSNKNIAGIWDGLEKYIDELEFTNTLDM